MQPTGALGWAPCLLSVGLSLVRLQPCSRAPFEKDWGLHPITRQGEVQAAFSHGENVGALLGARGGNVVDFDLDDRVVQANVDLMPGTAFAFGHACVGVTHRFYTVPDLPENFRRFTITSYARPGEKSAMLLELRGDGHQTMTLGSIWRDKAKENPRPDEPITNYGAYPLQRPTARPWGQILGQARLVGAIAVVARMWPGAETHRRNDFALRLTGGLVTHGLDPEFAKLIAERAARAAQDEEWERRGNEAGAAAERVAQGENVVGFSDLEREFDCQGFGKHLCDVLALPWKSEQSTKQEQPRPKQPQTTPAPVRVIPDTASLGIFTQGASLMRQSIEKPAWVVRDLILAGSYGIMQGRPKGGKSWLGLQLALCAAYGAPFLSQQIGGPQPVLLLALEDKMWRLQERMGRLLDGLELPRDERLDNLHLTILRENYASGEGHLAGLDWLAHLIETSKATLAIVDTQARLMGTLRQPGYESDYAVGVRFQELAQRTGCAILALTHTKKRQDQEEDHLDASQGTTGTTAAQDLVVTLGHARGTQLGRLRATGRDLDRDLDLALHYDPAKGPWFSDGDAPVVLSPGDRAALWLADFLSGGPQPQSRCVELGCAFLGMTRTRQWWGAVLAKIGGRTDKDGKGGWVWSAAGQEDSKDESEDTQILPFGGVE